jgi:hypothetical protein
LTSALILASSAAVISFSAKAVGHMAPSSRFASSFEISRSHNGNPPDPKLIKGA